MQKSDAAPGTFSESGAALACVLGTAHQLQPTRSTPSSIWRSLGRGFMGTGSGLIPAWLELTVSGPQHHPRCLGDDHGFLVRGVATMYGLTVFPGTAQINGTLPTALPEQP